MPHSDGRPHHDGLDYVREALSEKVLAHNGMIPPGATLQAAEEVEEMISDAKYGKDIFKNAKIVEITHALGLLCEACAFKRGVIYGILLQRLIGGEASASGDKLDYQAIMDMLEEDAKRRKDADGGE